MKKIFTAVIMITLSFFGYFLITKGNLPGEVPKKVQAQTLHPLLDEKDGFVLPVDTNADLKEDLRIVLSLEDSKTRLYFLKSLRQHVHCQVTIYKNKRPTLWGWY